MNEKIERIKTHFRDNKDRYITAIIASAATAVVIILEGRRQSEVHNEFKSLVHVGDNIPVTINIEKPGNSGDVLFDPVTQKGYLSRNQAAKELDTSLSSIRKKIADGDLVKLQDGNISKLEVA